jgi:23S rRNA pseudouridine2605 synthase
MWWKRWRKHSGPVDRTGMTAQRLQKAIANAGLMSRRAAEELIAAGRVTIDGRVAILGDRVEVGGHRVEVDGLPLPISPDLVTYLLYKPIGVVSTAKDPEGRPTVVDLVPPEPRVVPVGRLDADSEGLLLVSNDGELTLRVTHPRYGMTKTYVATVAGQPSRRTIRRLEVGIELDDGVAQARRAKLIQATPERAMIELVMTEGRNREIRRMLVSLGYPVQRLVRTAIGPLTDRNLGAGEWRRLDSQEVSGLYQAAGAEPPNS